MKPIYETDLLADLVLLLVYNDEEKVKRTLELVKTKSDSSLAERL